MGQTRAKYGGVLVKKTEQGSELRLTVMAWRDMITDQVEVRSGPAADLESPAACVSSGPKRGRIFARK